MHANVLEKNTECTGMIVSPYTLTAPAPVAEHVALT